MWLDSNDAQYEAERVVEEDAELPHGPERRQQQRRQQPLSCRHDTCASVVKTPPGHTISPEFEEPALFSSSPLPICLPAQETPGRTNFCTTRKQERICRSGTNEGTRTFFRVTHRHVPGSGATGDSAHLLGCRTEESCVSLLTSQLRLTSHTRSKRPGQSFAYMVT